MEFLVVKKYYLIYFVQGVTTLPLILVRFEGVYTYRGSKWAVLEELFAEVACLVDSSRKRTDGKGKIITACTKAGRCRYGDLTLHLLAWYTSGIS
jgi:hypothetical protein